MSKTLNEVVHKFSSLRLLVVGDIMLDRYVWGDVERISPEAPVPVLQVKMEDQRLGGAANVARNLCDLGAKVVIAGVVGRDQAGDSIRQMLVAHGMQAELILDEERPTTVKTRVIAQGQQVVRVDRESKSSLRRAVKSALKTALNSIDGLIDGIVVSDYAKGVVNQEIVELLSNMARSREIELVVDPKPCNAPCYIGAGTITPNEQEALAMIGSAMAVEPEVAAKKLNEQLNVPSVLITRGPRGMFAWNVDEGSREICSKAMEVYDVTGAGDTVAAVLSAALASGANLFDAAELANLAAGLVVAKIGTASVSSGELLDALDGSGR